MPRSHSVHRWRVIIACSRCGEGLLFGCSHDGRERTGPDAPWKTYSCVAIDTAQRRQKGRHHRCSLAATKRLTRRAPRETLRAAAERIFADMSKGS